MTNHQRSRYQAVIPESSVQERIKYRHLYRQRILPVLALERFYTFGGV